VKVEEIVVIAFVAFLYGAFLGFALAAYFWGCPQ
jgi:hypothetical protein